MGLSTSHGCFAGSYAQFAGFRAYLAGVAGYLPDEQQDGSDWLVVTWIDSLADEYTDQHAAGYWDGVPDDPLVILLTHSDCSGWISPWLAKALADRLEALQPHLDHPYWEDTNRRFAAGLRLAAAVGEPVEFA